MADFIVAITGGVASGKSEVARCFEALGRQVIDADVVARDVVAPGQPALEQIRAWFGESVFQPDGQLDRARLREQVFADPSARHELEAILHPLIRSELMTRAMAAPGPYAVIAVPLLAEGGGRSAYPAVQRIVVVDVPLARQQARLIQRDGSSPELALRMIQAQTSRHERLAIADDVIVNDGPLSQLPGVVAALDRRYCQQAMSA